MSDEGSSRRKKVSVSSKKHSRRSSHSQLGKGRKGSKRGKKRNKPPKILSDDSGSEAVSEAGSTANDDSFMLSLTSEKFLEVDAAHLLEAYKDAYDEVSRELRKPNVLLTGIIGSGKSSFINALFHDDIAPVGSGTSVTKHFDRYAPKNHPIVLFDSKGLEIGKSKEFIDSTNEFFREHKKKGGDISNCVHVVWYIVNSAMARFQDFEKDICHQLFRRIPIVFVLNKADLSSVAQRAALRKEISAMNLENCFGIFDTVCLSSTVAEFKNKMEECPSCLSDEISISRKKNIMICDKCSHKQSLMQPNGLIDVIKATISLLPVLARDSFIAAQKVSIEAKQVRAQGIIVGYSTDFEKVHQKNSLLKITAKMLTRLSIVWQFREHGNLYGVDVAKHMVKKLSLRDNVLLFIHKNNLQMYRSLAMGVLWNRCVRKLALMLVRDTLAIQNETQFKKLKGIWGEHLHSAFADLDEENLHQLEQEILKEGLEAVLKREMPSALREGSEMEDIALLLPEADVSTYSDKARSVNDLVLRNAPNVRQGENEVQTETIARKKRKKSAASARKKSTKKLRKQSAAAACRRPKSAKTSDKVPRKKSSKKRKKGKQQAD
eukprot:TRINITY_DN6662_c0_g1_i1.p1 TRINITY_DN6662_c0_g1~~TRINITY_DN6662_c0_g1_i1.p1  ORF type:complete len:625 (+),score=102.54 TRINITY_DN6662_c0_g1_i1:62-1876(+)